MTKLRYNLTILRLYGLISELFIRGNLVFGYEYFVDDKRISVNIVSLNNLIIKEVYEKYIYSENNYRFFVIYCCNKQDSLFLSFDNLSTDFNKLTLNEFLELIGDEILDLNLSKNELIELCNMYIDIIKDNESLIVNFIESVRNKNKDLLVDLLCE